MALDSRELLDVALNAGAKVRFQMIPGEMSDADGWLVSSQLADHDWSFHLLSDEHLQACDFDHLRFALPYAGPRTVTLVDEHGQEVQFRAWRTAWNMAPDGVGNLVPAGPSTSSPRGMVALTELPQPPERPQLPARQAPTPQQGPVLICGMHRSGTALLARLANLLGVELGNHMIGVHTPPISTNPKGHWEDINTIATHRRLLRHMTAVNSPWEWALSTSADATMISDEFRQELKELVNEKRGWGRWGIKDPRLSLLLPLWQELSPNACVMASVRDPLATAHSLWTNYCIPLSDGVRIWAAHYQRLLSDTAGHGHRLLIVHYDLLIQELPSQLARMAQFLGVPEPSADVRDECERFADSKLRHYLNDGEDLRGQLTVVMGRDAREGEVEQIARLHEHLCNMALANVQMTHKVAPKAQEPMPLAMPTPDLSQFLDPKAASSAGARGR